MECLSLILLNPAPERNPLNQRWDPEAQLHVKEIKVTFWPRLPFFKFVNIPCS